MTRKILEFLIEAGRIKSLRRTGWVWLKVKNPETVAEHSFRTAVMAWLLGEKTGLNVNRMIQIALVHDICEAYAGDITPYYGILPKDKKKWRPVLKRWVRLPRKKKEELARRKFLLEKKSLTKLLAPIPSRTRKELFSLWRAFESGASPEGKFVRQLDRIEALLQAIEYFGTAPGTPVVGWWEGLEELVEHPLLLDFLKAVELHFYHKKKTPFSPLIDFFLYAGKLKRMPRYSWAVRGISNPESLANHTFMLALMTLTAIKNGRIRLNTRRVLTMSLIYLFPYILMREPTPYDAMLKNAKTARDKRRIFQTWVRLPLKEKQALAKKRRRMETRAIERLTSSLDKKGREEIRNLWTTLRERSTPEAILIRQLYVAELLLQALCYRAADPKFSIEPWWEWAYEFDGEPYLRDFMEALKERFYPLETKLALGKKPHAKSRGAKLNSYRQRAVR